MNVRHYLAAASALTILAPAHAAQQQPSKPIVVTAVSVDQWAAQTSKSLSGKLRYPTYLMGREANEGIVRVRFECSDSGAPAAVALLDSSGHRELDNEAMRAVNAIRTLHPLPDGIAHDQQFQAVVLFARNEQSYRRQAKAIREQAAWQNSRFVRGKAPLMASVGLLPVR
jgi:TonB family protein